MISYIVSVYDRAVTLNACLASLSVQPQDKQILVTLNGNEEQNKAIKEVTGRYNVICSHTGMSGATNCYDAALMCIETRINRGPSVGQPLNIVKGDWLCFPSDDSLYVADFQKTMMETAVRERADLVYCDMVYKCGSEVNGWKPYSVLSCEPRMGKIDKTNFIIRRELFKGFPPHRRNWRDGALIEQAIRDGAKPAKAPGVLVVHQ